MQALARRTRARYYRAFQASDLAQVIDDVLDRVDKAASYDLAYLDDPQPLSPALAERIQEGTPPSPDLENEPASPSGRSPLLGWLPALLLLAGVAAFAGYRKRSRALQTPPVPVFGSGEPAPTAQLLDFGGVLGEAGEAIPLSNDRITIGRDPHNQIVIADETVSSEHAVIEFQDGRYWLQDRRSTNGTRLANKKILAEERYALKGGDRIRFADVDLMFVVEGYVPGGDTVYLSSSTTPPPEWARADAYAPPADDPKVPSQEIVFAEERERLDPAEVANLDGALPAASQGARELEEAQRTPDREAVARAERALAAVSEDSNPDDRRDAEASTNDSSGLDLEKIRECLDYHLARVTEISPDFEAFVHRAFHEELRTALPVAAAELIQEASGTGQIIQRAYTHDRIRYVVCGVPGGMQKAQQLYSENYGGFTRVLSEQLQSSSFSGDRCEILALLSFGFDDAPWVSLSIVPDDGYQPRIDLLSYEFLTEEERREIEPETDSQISQSGIA